MILKFFSSKNNFSEFKIFGLIFLLSILLPYIWFGTRLNLGGDQGNTYLLYPGSFFENISLKNWYPIGIGYFNPSYFTAPFMFIGGIFKQIPQPIFVFHHLVYSLVFFFSFYYFSKVLNLLFGLPKWIEIIIALLFASSPISSFIIYEIPLYTIFTAPLMMFYLYKYLKLLVKNLDLLEKIREYIHTSIVTFFFSIGLFQIPWILPFAIVFIFCTLVLFLEKKTSFKKFLVSSFFFGLFIFISSLFWIVPFLSQFLRQEDSLAKGFFAESGVEDTFSPTVNTLSAYTNALNPFINLEHYKLYERLETPRFYLYESYFLNLIFINFLIPIILLIAIILVTINQVNLKTKLKYLLFLVAFVILSFSYTVDVPDPNFKDVFIYLGKNLPGFFMFRNFIGKFSLAVAAALFLLLASAIEFAHVHFRTYSFNQKFTSRFQRYLNIFLICIFVFNFLPFLAGGYTHTKIWRSDNIYRKISDLNPDYYDIIDYTKDNVPHKYKVMNLNLNHSGYEVIEDSDPNSSNLFLGNSPLPILTGHNNFISTKGLSVLRDSFNSLVREQKFQEVGIFLDLLGVKYIIQSKERPDSLNYQWFEESWLTEGLESEDFKETVLGELEYSNNSYSLFRTKLYDKPLIKDYNKISVIDESGSTNSVNNILSLRKVLEEDIMIIDRSSLENLDSEVIAEEIKKINPLQSSKYRNQSEEILVNTLGDNYHELSITLQENILVFAKSEEVVLAGKSYTYQDKQSKDFEVNRESFAGLQFNQLNFSKNDLPIDIAKQNNQNIAVLEYLSGEDNFSLDLSREGHRQTDCSPNRNFELVNFTYNEEGKSIVLDSSDGSNACIYREIDISNNDSNYIALEFNRRSDNDAKLVVELLNEERQRLEVITKTLDQEVEGLGFIFNLEEKHEYFRYYLESGSSKEATNSKSEYSNLKVRKVKPSATNLEVSFMDNYYLDKVEPTEKNNQQKLKNINFELTDWAKADCQKVTNFSDNASISIEDDQSFTITSKNFHAGCIRLRKGIQPNRNLYFDFEAKNIYNSPEIILFVNYNDDDLSFSREVITLDAEDNRYRLTLDTPSKSTEAVIHFVAFPQALENSFSIEDIQIYNSPKFFDSVYSLNQNLLNEDQYQTSLNEMPVDYDTNSESYILKIEEKVNYLSIPQLYDTGWKVQNLRNDSFRGFGFVNSYELLSNQNDLNELVFKFEFSIFGIDFRTIFYAFLITHSSFLLLLIAIHIKFRYKYRV